MQWMDSRLLQNINREKFSKIYLSGFVDPSMSKFTLDYSNVIYLDVRILILVIYNFWWAMKTSNSACLSIQSWTQFGLSRDKDAGQDSSKSRACCSRYCVASVGIIITVKELKLTNFPTWMQLLIQLVIIYTALPACVSATWRDRTSQTIRLRCCCSTWLWAASWKVSSSQQWGRHPRWGPASSLLPPTGLCW